MSRIPLRMDRVDEVAVRGLARQSPHGRVLAGVARGLDQLFPPVPAPTRDAPPSCGREDGAIGPASASTGRDGAD